MSPAGTRPEAAPAAANPHDRWTGNEAAAATRIAARVVLPVGRQSFVASPDDSFFAIGSCFARNVEERLDLAGARVLSRNIQVRDLGDASAREGGTFNKYTPVSMLQELRWAAGLDSYPEAALLQVGGGQFYDPYLSGKAGRGSRDELMARRAEVAGYFAQAFAADVVIVTLGLTESWTDRDTGLALNEAPAPRLLARDQAAGGAGRFVFSRLTLEDCEAALDGIFAVLDAKSKPGQRRIVTVSPVPLGRTFTDEDIIVANMVSKSTLLVAAQRLVARAPRTDYFPSYEAVTLSDPALSWQSDRRHASDFIVGQVIQGFLTRYGVVAEAPADAAAEIAALRSDPAVQRWSETGGDGEVLLARLNHELNKYKNMVIRMQAEQRRGTPRPAAERPSPSRGVLGDR